MNHDHVPESMIAERVTKLCRGPALPTLIVMALMIFCVFFFLLIATGFVVRSHLPKWLLTPAAIAALSAGLFVPLKLSTMVARWRSRRVQVGPDGVFITRRFVSFAEVADVLRKEHKGQWLLLKRGGRVLVAGDPAFHHEDSRRLTLTIRDALVAFRERQDEHADPVVGILGALSPSERDQVLAETSGYREATLTRDALVATLRDPVTPAELRVYLAKRLKRELAPETLRAIRRRSANVELTYVLGPASMKARVETREQEHAEVTGDDEEQTNEA